MGQSGTTSEDMVSAERQIEHEGFTSGTLTSWSVEDIERAAKLANAHEFIEALPEGTLGKTKQNTADRISILLPFYSSALRILRLEIVAE